MSDTPTPNKQFKFANFDNIITHMQAKIKKYISLNLYKNALFFAEKLFYISLDTDSSSFAQYLYILAKCYYLNKEYSRCVNIIQKYNIYYYNLNFLVLYGDALFKCEDYESVIAYLDKENIIFEMNDNNNINNTNNPINNNTNNNPFLSLESDENVLKGAIHLLIGKSFEIQENKKSAIKHYLLALKYDLENIEAFENLMNRQLLSGEGKSKILEDLNFSNDNLWILDFYKSKVNDSIFITSNSNTEITRNISLGSKFSNKLVNSFIKSNFSLQNNNQYSPQDENNLQPSANSISNIMDILYKAHDPSLMQLEAEKMFLARDYTSTYTRLQKLHNEDFYNLSIIPMLCSSMIELNKVGDLYSLAYKLVNHCSDNYISWYTVGCYYYCIKKYENARKNFLKCNQMNKNFPEGWIALGNSYSGEDESDQALNSYRTCLRLFPGAHYSNLYIGMEYLRMNNSKTAFLAFQNALRANQKDPLIFNEIGVVCYLNGAFEEAKNNFLKGIEICSKNEVSMTMQTLMINLGHSYRKMGDYIEALKVYLKLYYIDSENVDVLSAIGFTMSLLGEYNIALKFLHSANFIKSNENFPIAMISRCMNEVN